MYEDKPLPSVVEAYRRIKGVDPLTAGKKNTSGDYIVPCVSTANHRHGDASPSLRINPEQDVWRCDPCAAQGVDGGKSTHLVVHAGLARDLSEASKWLCPPELKRAPPPIDQQKLVAEYDYCAAAGNTLFQVRRFEWTVEGEAKPRKTFYQRRLLDNGSWDNRLGDVERVPFRFPQIIYAAGEGKTIYVVGGEKSVLALETLGLVATTNAGGEGWKWDAKFLECFRGFPRVIVIGDNDDTGRAAARAHADALAHVCGQVWCVESLPGVPHKGDAVEWIDAHPGCTEKDFRRAIHSVAKPVGVEIDDGSVSPMDLTVLHLKMYAQQSAIVPAVPFNIPKFDDALGGMQEGRVTVLAARTNQGKTALAVRIGVLAAYGCRVLVLSFEMGMAQWHDRLFAQHHGLTVIEYRAKRRSDPTIPDLDYSRSLDMLVAGGGKDATIDRIDELVAIHQPKLVIVDHLRLLRGWMGGGKNRADLAASEIMYAFPDVAKKRKTHFLLLHQLNRQAADEPALADLRDAGAVEEAADNVILIDRPFKTIRGERSAEQADDVMHAHLAKSREGAEAFAHLSWDGPRMLPGGYPPERRDWFTRCCPK